MTNDDSDKKNGSVARALCILEELSKQSEINLETLSKNVALPKTTVLRFLTTFTELGYVRKNHYDEYSLTLRMFSIGARSLEHFDLNKIAMPIANELSESIGETVHMGILENNEAVYVLKVESKYSIRMHSRIGKTIPLYCTAIGKMLLSSQDEDEMQERIELIKKAGFTKYTSKTFCDEASLKAELTKIKSNGYSVDDEENEEGVICIAAPIHDYTQKVIAAISISWPLFRFDAEQKETYISKLKDAAHRISLQLGC